MVLQAANGALLHLATTQTGVLHQHPLNAIGDAKIDCFEHFWQPSGREAALLRLVDARHVEAERKPRGQIAKASSSNATSSRRVTGASTASS